MFKCRTTELTRKIEKIDLNHSVNMRVGKISSSAEYRIDEEFQNCQFLVL